MRAARRRSFCVASIGALFFQWNGFAPAQDAYPSRPIRLIVSFTPGGGADLTARTVGQGMAAVLRQALVVENRPGANGLVGAAAVAKTAPDRYTPLLTGRGAGADVRAHRLYAAPHCPGRPGRNPEPLQQPALRSVTGLRVRWHRHFG